MAIEICMPRLSQTTDDVRFLRWLVKEGESINKGEPLCEVETDKTTMEVESFEGGTVLKLFSIPDEVVSAGSVIAVLGSPGEKVPEHISERASERGDLAAGPKKTKIIAETSGVKISEKEDGIRTTHLVRNIARKKGIDLTCVTGSGPRGLITKKDIEDYVKSRGREAVAAEGAGEYPLSRNQVMVARNLLRSKSEAPHFYLKCQVFTDSISAFREKNLLPDGTKVSVYSIFIHAAARALEDFPHLNGYFREGKVVLFQGIHVGFAVTAGDELYVPVIRETDKKTIKEIDREVKWLVAKAQNGKLELQDIMGSTFTITNLGIFPVDEFYAIINPPQAGILSIGQIKKTLYIDENDAMHIRQSCSVTGSFDHRFINGAKGAAFLQRYKQILEEEIL